MKTSELQTINCPGKQRGAVLVFCLVFLAVLTLLGVSSMESAVLEERMAGNMQDYNLAFQAAESALRDAESWLDVQNILPLQSANGTTVVWTENSMDPLAGDGVHWWEDGNVSHAWWDANSQIPGGFQGTAAQPQYIIEEYHVVSGGQSIAIGDGEPPMRRVVHRITGHAVGATASAEVLVQSTFVKPYE